jgi:hypothetical protein
MITAKRRACADESLRRDAGAIAYPFETDSVTVAAWSNCLRRRNRPASFLWADKYLSRLDRPAPPRGGGAHVLFRVEAGRSATHDALWAFAAPVVLAGLIGEQPARDDAEFQPSTPASFPFRLQPSPHAPGLGDPPRLRPVARQRQRIAGALRSRSRADCQSVFSLCSVSDSAICWMWLSGRWFRGATDSVRREN